MGALSASEIVSVWERGNGRHPVDRALVLLAAACPGVDAEELASFAIGRRNSCLLRLRERIFGPTAAGAARCPRCSEALEFTIRTAGLVENEQPAGERLLEFLGRCVRKQHRRRERELPVADCHTLEDARGERPTSHHRLSTVNRFRLARKTVLESGRRCRVPRLPSSLGARGPPAPPWGDRSTPA